ncbi:MAG: MBL fold metallo-hydrolase [Candidatus Riflebacteria bacterium]|nr:MBL fold metallo-hydrolase [Candidatus Riflebacteria bacterium]
MSKRLLRVLIAIFFAYSLAFQAYATTPLLHVTFLDVGQGDSALIRTAEKVILLDAGDDRFNVGETVILPYLKKEGIKKIDTCIISHPHRDHFGGFMDIVNAMPIGEFLYSTDMIGDNAPEGGSGDGMQYQKLHDAIVEKKIPYRQVRVGDTFDWGKNINVELVHAAEGIFAAHLTTPRVIGASSATDAVKISANEHSLIFRVAAGDISYLFPGDAEKGAEANTVTAFGSKLKSTILKSGHHGSKTSSSYPFMDAVKPDYAVISVGKGNSFGHPNKETLDTYALYKMTVFRTDEDGTVDTVTDGKTVKFTSNQSPIEISEAPQLISLTANSATIKWSTNKDSNTQVAYGTTDLANTKVTENATTLHTITLVGLKPSTAYRFAVTSRDARQADQTVSADGTFSTPAGDGKPLPKIAALSINQKTIFARRQFAFTASIANPAKGAASTVSLELYHTCMSPDTLIQTHDNLNVPAGGSLKDVFDTEITWVGQLELIAVLKKDGKIIDTNSMTINVQPKIFMVDAAHGNMDYNVGKFAGMRVDLAKNLGFEFQSFSNPINKDTLTNAFVVTLPDPDKPFAPDELAALKAYVGKGGSLLLFCRADYSNHSHPAFLNDVLNAVGSGIRFNDDEVCDPTNNIGYPWGMFVQTFPSPVINGVKNLLVRSCCSLLNSKLEGLTANKHVQLLATGDTDSYDVDADGLNDGWIYASHTPKLPIPIAACEDLGAGRVACIGETLYDDKLYAPSPQLQTPEFNRCVISWLAMAREKTLRELITAAGELKDVSDAELRAVRYEGIRSRALDLSASYVKIGRPDAIQDAFSGLSGYGVDKLKAEIESTIKFSHVHGEDVKQ